MSLIVRVETLGLFFNTWIADDKYLVHAKENLTQSFKRHFSDKLKTSNQIFTAYFRLSLVFSKLLTPKDVAT